ncbi:hypothetical protein F4823DRAFT_106401 [Ustulina deusta]|nr:hypothetical protein F4823DRAFT_106401 [Ustulina deusta]
MPIGYQGARVPASYATCRIGHKTSHMLRRSSKPKRPPDSTGWGYRRRHPRYSKQLHAQEPGREKGRIQRRRRDYVGDIPLAELEGKWKGCLKEPAAAFPPEKIFPLQVSDAHLSGR